MIALKDLSNGKTFISIFVWLSQVGTMVKIRAAREVKFNKKFRQRIRWLQGVNQQCLFPVAQKLQIDAQVLF